MAIHMVVSSKGCKNIRCSLAFFDKANGNKIVPPMPIACWNDGSAMLERLHHKNDGERKIVKWKFKVKEGWLPYIFLLFHLFASEKEFVNPGKITKWMETGCWCQVCLNSLGLEGAYELGSCSYVFHVG